mmetsp:Transcript_14380/g.41345  ORF Transcript_14380/g.41345 Transcript_14380/m.41345 type:complete len:241 (-) Transcript_14380:273-995(-)
MFALSRIAVRTVVAPNAPHCLPTSPGIGLLGQRGTPSLLATRHFGRGQGDAGGWPSTTGNPSGGGRSNNPPQALEKERDARGRQTLYCLYEGDHVGKCFREQVTSIACGGKATIMFFEDGDTAWTSELTTQLYNKLNGRQKSLPKPEYVALGSNDRYYIRFRDGSSRWEGCDQMTEAIHGTDRSVNTVLLESLVIHILLYSTMDGTPGTTFHPNLTNDLKKEDGYPTSTACHWGRTESIL